MRRHSTATLMGMTKKELVEYVRIAEHNQEVAEEALKQQAENVKDWCPVRHGRWVKQWCDNNMIGHEYAECSVCGCSMLDTNQFWNSKHCPNCGTKMDKEKENV